MDFQSHDSFEGSKVGFLPENVSAQVATIQGVIQSTRFVRAKAARLLVDGLERDKGHPSTGIQTTHRLMLALTYNGYNDAAYPRLNQRTFHSLRLMIDNGATTIRERWDGYVTGRGFCEPYMNSFKTVAFGSVSEWMWRTIVGINPDDAAPGYQHFKIRPLPGGGLTWAKGEYKSIRGPVASEWRIRNGTIALKVSVPVNTHATVYVPTNDPTSVRENGRSIRDAKGLKSVRSDETAAVFRCGSGTYEFVAPY